MFTCIRKAALINLRDVLSTTETKEMLVPTPFLASVTPTFLASFSGTYPLQT